MADFSELKAAIRADIKENTEQEIGGDLLQGDLIRMVDDINAAKVDKEGGKGLSSNDFTDEDKEKLDSIPSDICPDVPADAPSPLYGRTPTHEWQPIALVSGLHIELTIPSSANPSEYEIILSYGDGSVRRAIEYVDGGITLTDIPAGMRVTVNIKPPHNYTAPRSKTYTSQLGVIENYSGTSIYIVDGVYVLDKWGSYTDWQAWNANNNNLAIGIGYKSSGTSFVVAKVWGRTDNPLGGSNQAVAFGSYNVDCGAMGMLQAATTNDAGPLVCGEQNSRLMVESHIALQEHWRDENIINTDDAGYFPAAMVAHKFKTDYDDDYGNWRLPDCVEGKLIFITDVKYALTRIGSAIPSLNLGDWGVVSACPCSDNQTFFGIGRYNTVYQSTSGTTPRASNTQIKFSAGYVYPVRAF